MTFFEQLNASGNIGTFINDITDMGYAIGDSSSTLIGQTLGELTFTFRKRGTPTSATMSFQVYNSAGTLKHTFGTIHTDDISTTATAYTRNSGQHNLLNGDRIVLNCSAPGSLGANSIELKGTAPSTVSGTPTYMQNARQTNGTWNDNISDEMPYIILAEGAAPSSSTTFYPPPPAYITL
jgi:hypothetical protein